MPDQSLSSLPFDLQAVYERSVEEFGIEHTHDVTCRTWWRQHNWVGACDCSLPMRAPAMVAEPSVNRRLGPGNDHADPR